MASKLPSDFGLVLLSALILAGCGDRTPAREKSVAALEQRVAATNEAAIADTPEQKMRDLLDEGDELGAIRAARNLMDSTSTVVRAEVVDVLSWIGRPALPELVELADDASSDIRQAAMSGIEQALGEVNGDNLKALEIGKVVTKLKRSDQFESVFMLLTDIDEAVALRLLARLITEHPATQVAEAAREFYTHLSGGEIFDSMEATENFIKAEKGKQE